MSLMLGMASGPEDPRNEREHDHYDIVDSNVPGDHGP